MTDPLRDKLLVAGWREQDGRWIAPPLLHSIRRLRKHINGSRRLGFEDAVAINNLAELSRGKRKK